MKAKNQPGYHRPLKSSPPPMDPANVTLKQLAQKHTEECIAVLLDIAQNGKTEACRVTAANMLPDRAHGRPTKTTEAPPQKAKTNIQVMFGELPAAAQITHDQTITIDEEEDA